MDISALENKLITILRGITIILKALLLYQENKINMNNAYTIINHYWYNFDELFINSKVKYG